MNILQSSPLYCVSQIHDLGSGLETLSQIGKYIVLLSFNMYPKHQMKVLGGVVIKMKVQIIVVLPLRCPVQNDGP